MRKKTSQHSGRGEGPNPVDIFVGQRVRQRRTLLGLSQERIADVLGLTFQQVQKYERGANRISASRLFDLTRILDTDADYFFQGMPEAIAKNSPGQRYANPRGAAEGDVMPLPPADPSLRRETLELVRAYYRIQNEDLRRSVLQLIRAILKERGVSDGEG